MDRLEAGHRWGGDLELRRRAVEGLAYEVAALGSGAPDSRVLRREGVVAAISPSVPERSLFNSVYYEDVATLREMLEELESVYAEAGVRAWTVWVPEDDRDAAGLLASRGHLLDASPRAMALWLDDIGPEPPAPDWLTVTSGDPLTGAALNDRAYGLEMPTFRAAMTGESDPPMRWTLALRGDEPLACVATLDAGDDCCVTAVATTPEHRGLGIASRLLHGVLIEARGRGFRSASLQSTKAGFNAYRRLGFRDVGYIEMWERREPI